ncbi:MAG TPA: hypothetical protein VMP08_17100 [Anaerolineae bacterium]|nr:hypothetical protein [Anaerolineae bacterium]
MRRAILIFCLMLLSGCRTFEIGFVQTPTPDRTTPDRATAAPSSSPTPTVTATLEPATAEPTATATITPTATKRPAPKSIAPTATSTPQPQGPTILDFLVEPSVVSPGDVVGLYWSVTNTTAVDIYQYVPDTLPSYNTLNLSPTGQVTQTIRAEERLWQSFTLSASNSAGVITQTITIAIRCPYTYFFNPLPAEDQADWSCPDGEPITSTAAEQVFEHGRMIWLQHDNRIYIFFADGTYQTFDDTWVAGQPDSVPGLTPPAERFMPVRGFGKVWSSEADIRSRLGWALAEERGFETQMQGGWLRCCSSLNAVNRPIYLRNVEGRIVRLWPGEMPPGQWKWVE